MNKRSRMVWGRRTALALAAGLVAGAMPAGAVVVVSGAWSVGGGGAAVGPGDTLLPTQGLWVGNGAAANLRVDAGSFLQVASLVFGSGSTGSGSGVLSGAGSLVALVGNGFSQGSLNRLEVGGWGQGQFTVSDGATLDGRANASACVGEFHYCNNFIGNAAGSTSTFTVTGSGSSASLLRGFVIGGLAVFHPPIDTFTFGTPGGTTRGRVEVLAGGSLTTDFGSVGVAPGGGSPMGTERSLGEVAIDGAGSVWRLTGATLDATGARLSTGEHRNAVASLSVTNGGLLLIDGKAGQQNGVGLSTGGGRTDMLISGAGSTLQYLGDAGYLNVGRSNGSARLVVNAGGAVDNPFYVSVGRDGSFGDLVVDGVGSRLSLTGTASVAALGSAQNPVMDIGRNGTGQVTVSNGARIELLATEARVNGPQLSVGRDAASAGALTISGVGSTVALSAQSVLAGGGPGEAVNPFVRVGRDGSGTLTINGGGQLLIDGRAVSTVADSRGTSLYIGGTGDTANGGKGIALVTGAGSAIRMTGSDTFIAVGIGPQSVGQLTVADGAEVSAIGMNVGRSGGVGVLALDHGNLNFSGQYTGATLSGAFLSIGRSGGIGVATLANGSQLTLSNHGSEGASLNLGGTGPGPLGDGTLTVSGGSRIVVDAAPGLATLSVGRDGSALMRVKGGSTVDVGDGNTFVGRLKGSDGTLLISEHSALSTGWLGVGRNRTATGDVDGGTGTLVLINSTLTARDIVIGTNGFLGGNGTIVGSVVNHGIFSPGTSPGTMVIDGDYRSDATARLILEVEDDGHGGFVTDHVVFTAGHAVDLSDLKVEFRFLAHTDPTRFQASGQFDTDHFFQLKAADGSLGTLSDAVFASAQFSATAADYSLANFSYTTASGASFTATPVPEPASWALLATGVLGLAWRARRMQAR